MTDTTGIRRIVTGHDETGQSVILEDGPAPQFNATTNERVQYFEIWNTEGAPTPITAVPAKEPNDRPLILPPPTNGTIIRIIDVFPGNHTKMKPREDGRSPGMHRTKTIDYGMVISGEIVLVVDNAERLMQAGDICIQRGTDHAWENRSDEPCRMMFVLVDGEFDPDLQANVPGMQLNVAAPSLSQDEH